MKGKMESMVAKIDMSKVLFFFFFFFEGQMEIHGVNDEKIGVSP